MATGLLGRSISPNLRANLNTQIRRIEVLRHRAPIFAHLQMRSGIAIREMLDSGTFRDPDTIATEMGGLMSRVASGLEGQGTRLASLNRAIAPGFPQLTNIVFGPTVHISQDIGGGLDDVLRLYDRLPDPDDQRTMYAAVRASMITLSRDLRAQSGWNITSLGMDQHEAIVLGTNRDVIQMLRDQLYRNRGGAVSILGLPPGLEHVNFATQIIQGDPISLQEIVPGWNGDLGSSL